MSNHYHLFFRTPDTNLSLGMKDLDGDYASSFNARRRRVGHLFQGRFKSHLVDSETYLLTLARYTVAMQGYREFVAAGVGQEASPWENLLAQAFLGGAAFLQKVEERIRAHKCSDQHPREQRGYRANTIETVRKAIESMGIADRCPPPAGSDARVLFVLLAERHTNATRAHMGRHLGISGAGVAYLFRIGEARLQADGAFAALVREGDSRLATAREDGERRQL